MKKWLLMKKLNMHCNNNAKVNLLMTNSKRENHYMVISHISVWSEVTLDIDFFEKKHCFQLTNT